MLTLNDRRAGGLTTSAKIAPRGTRCPRCGKSFSGKPWMAYIGHKGLHGLADRYFSGCLSSAARRMALNSVAKYDPAPWNGAFQYKPIQPYIVKGATTMTNFADIQFNADQHKYFLQGQELISVTTRLKGVQKPFDRDRISRRVAEREGRPQADILAEWEAKGEAGRQLGTQVHQYIEQQLTNNTEPVDPFLLLNKKPAECVAWDSCWEELAKLLSVKEVEWIIGDAELGLAGTVDLFAYSQKTGKHHIVDWKTGKFDQHNRWENLLSPFNGLDASKLHIYSLQQSLYRLIIERNSCIEVGDGYLVHLQADGFFTVYRAVDLREPLLKWLT